MKSINAQPDERSIYGWNIVGSVVNALMSVVVLMIVTRTLNSRQADTFSIAWSIAQLMATIATFQIRTYQATDIVERFRFQQYLVFRVITVTIMLIVSIIYIFAKGYDFYKGSIIFVVCLFRAVEAFDDLFEGYFQQKERLDLAGKATTVRIIIGVIGFGVTVVVFRNLMISCLVLLMVYITCFFSFNLRYCLNVQLLKIKKGFDKNMFFLCQLAVAVAPIFINSFLMMSISNTPKMAIDFAIENGYMENGMQTVFNILFMPASVLTLVYIVFRPMLTQLAIFWSEKRTKRFMQLLIKMSIFLLGISVAVIIGSSLFGISILSIVYAIDLKQYNMALLIIVIGGCFCTFSFVLDNALIVIRKQYMLVLSYMVTWIYIKVIAKFMLGKWGMNGAALSYASAMLVFFLVTLTIFLGCFIKNKSS